LLNEFFTSCFNPAVQPPSYSELSQSAEGDAAVYDITQDKVYMHLRTIKFHSAAGPDGIIPDVVYLRRYYLPLP